MTMRPDIPAHAQVLIIGGGPAGSYAASLCAREGLSVVVLEMGKYPKYHIGESLIPSVRPFLRFIGAEQKMVDSHFVRKPGAAIQFAQHASAGYTDFMGIGHNNYAWNVKRSEFDELLINHARESGAAVFEQTKALSIAFPIANDQPFTVSWDHRLLPGEQAASPVSPAPASPLPAPATPDLCATPSPEATPTTPPPVTPSFSGARRFLRNRKASLSLPTFLGFGEQSPVSNDVSFSPPSPTTTRGSLLSPSPLLSLRRRQSSISSMSSFGSFFGRGEDSPPTSPVTADAPSIQGSITCDWLIDASGRSGIVSTKYRQDRHFNESLRNVAIWGYWKGVKTYGEDTPREGAPYFEALSDESGWAWFIPLHDQTTSIGFVRHRDKFEQRKDDNDLTKRYDAAFRLAPHTRDLLGEGKMLTPKVRMASDYSYSASTYAGNRYRIAGDAGAFIDPLFSSGIHLAMTSALSAVATILASKRGSRTEEFCAKWHTERVATSYTRFQFVVLSAYKQIRQQNIDVLQDVGEENYVRAFNAWRAVIQGAADLGPLVTDDEIQRSLDFCINIFNPTTPEQHKQAAQQALSKDLLDVNGPIVHPDTLRTALDTLEIGDVGSTQREDLQRVLDKINARRVVHAEYDVNNLEAEPIDGYAIHLKRGELGLKCVEE